MNLMHDLADQISDELWEAMEQKLTTYKKDKDAYLIELVVVRQKPIGPAMAEVWCETIIESDDDGSPRIFKNRQLANKWVTALLKQGDMEIKAYAIRKFKMVRETRV